MRRRISLTTSLALFVLLGTSAWMTRADTRSAAVVRADVTPKLWVDDLAQFTSINAGRIWIVGQADAPCLSEAECYQGASRDACAKLLLLLRGRVPGLYDERNEEWMQQRLARELARGRLITDRSVSVSHRPYGDIWSEAILVDASSDRLGQIERDYAGWLNERARMRRGAVASIFGLSLAILAIYGCLNAVTKGYLRGRLRVGAAVVMIAGLLVAMAAIRGWGMTPA